MTASDIIEVESKLGIQVPPNYREFMTSRSGQMAADMFCDAHQIIAANERVRQMSWLGRPLDRFFYIFGADKRGRELFMDLDTFGPVIMVADHERKQGKVQALTFKDWISKYDHVA
jgi:hypothetical protein